MAVSAGHITDLTLNDHACLTFGEPEELFDLTAVSVLCQYDREQFDPVTLATVASVHTRPMARRPA